MGTVSQLYTRKRRRDNRTYMAEAKTTESIDSIPYLIKNRDNSKLVKRSLHRKLKKGRESNYLPSALPRAALLSYIPSDVLKNCILSLLNNPLDRLSIQLTCRTFREISDSREMLRGFNFCSESGNDGDFFHFKTADGAIKCLYKFAKHGNLQALERIGVTTLHFYANPLGASIIHYVYLLGYFRSSQISGHQKNKLVWISQCEATANEGEFCDGMDQIFQTIRHMKGIWHPSCCWNPLCCHSVPNHRKMPAIIEAAVQQLVEDLSYIYDRSMSPSQNAQNPAKFWKSLILKKCSQYCCVDCLQC